MGERKKHISSHPDFLKKSDASHLWVAGIPLGLFDPNVTFSRLRPTKTFAGYHSGRLLEVTRSKDEIRIKDPLDPGGSYFESLWANSCVSFSSRTNRYYNTGNVHPDFATPHLCRAALSYFHRQNLPIHSIMGFWVPGEDTFDYYLERVRQLKKEKQRGRRIYSDQEAEFIAVAGTGMYQHIALPAGFSHHTQPDIRRTVFQRAVYGVYVYFEQPGSESIPGIQSNPYLPDYQRFLQDWNYV